MKLLTYVAIALISSFAAPVLLAQIDAVEAGSAEALQRQQEYQRRLHEGKHELDRCLKIGKDLFGTDKRWSRTVDASNKSELAGTLFFKQPPDFQVGDWGCTMAQFETIQKLNDRECLVQPRYRGSNLMLLRGFDMTKVTDGIHFILQHPVIIDETFSYETTAGGRKTVLVIGRNELKVTEAAASAREAIEAGLFRTWSAAKGKQTIEAKFIGVVQGKARLEKKDRSIIEVGIGQLSSADQKCIRELQSSKSESRPKTLERAAQEPRPIAPSTELKNSAEDSTLSKWVNTSYDTTIYRVDGKKWAERDNKTKKIKWHLTETGSGEGFVELFNEARSETWRVSEKRTELKSDDRLTWLANGHWVNQSN